MVIYHNVRCQQDYATIILHSEIEFDILVTNQRFVIPTDPVEDFSSVATVSGSIDALYAGLLVAIL